MPALLVSLLLCAVIGQAGRAQRSDGEAPASEVVNMGPVGETAPGFDLWAPTYEEDSLGLGWRAHRDSGDLLRPWLRNETATAFDAGCGTGIMADVWRGLGVANVTGMDLSAGMLDQALRRQFYNRLIRRSLDAPLPFEDGSFDVIASIGVLSYVLPENRLSVLREFVRVAKPSGLVTFSHRTDYIVDQGWQQHQQRLVGSGEWELLASDELPNLPESTAHGCSTLTHFVYRVRGMLTE